MTDHARRIWNSPAKIRNVATKAHRMVMSEQHHSVGNYFLHRLFHREQDEHPFWHWWDTDKTDRQETRQGNQRTDYRTDTCPGSGTGRRSRTRLSDVRSKKMTFPNDKLLTIEMTEKQISGRNISLNIDYEDILAADLFHADLLEEEWLWKRQSSW